MLKQRVHMPHQRSKILHATIKTWYSQINKFFKKRLSLKKEKENKAELNEWRGGIKFMDQNTQCC